MTSERLDIRMLVKVERSQFAFSSGVTPCDVIAYPVHVVREDGVEQLRNFNGDSSLSDDPALKLADLQVRANGDSESEPKIWGYRVEYRDVFSVNRQRAEAMAKTLKKIERGLDRLVQELGYVESFPAYLVRVARILGINQFGFTNPNGDTMWASGERFRFIGPDSLAGYLDTQVRKVLDD